jgi:hypothetical protein
MMTYRGEVKDGVIVLAGGVQLPEGTVVEVIAAPAAPALGNDRQIRNAGIRHWLNSMRSELPLTHHP